MFSRVVALNAQGQPARKHHEKEGKKFRYFYQFLIKIAIYSL